MSEIKLSSPVKDFPQSSPSQDRRLSDDAARMYAWEHGQIDYMGRDSFENIQKKLDEIINNVKE